METDIQRRNGSGRNGIVETHPDSDFAAAVEIKKNRRFREEVPFLFFHECMEISGFHTVVVET